MKKIILPILIAAGLVISGVAMLNTGCTKEGPEGPAGADGNATCGECHNDDANIVTAAGQFDYSLHKELVIENRTGCVFCHTGQGFQARIGSPDTTWTFPVVANPSHLTCYSCHKIHESYTGSDLKLRKEGAYTLKVSNQTVNHGKGAVCIMCHQARPRSPFISFPIAATDSFSVTSSTWGPHHSVQGTVLNGLSPLPIAGSIAYPTENKHVTQLADGCVNCHMAPGADLNGGHTFAMLSEEGATNAANACASCHSGLTNYNKDNKQTEISGLLQQLKVKLAQLNVYDTINDRVKTGKKPSKYYAAAYNYMLAAFDGSKGVHYYSYTKALVKNSLEAIQ